VCVIPFVSILHITGQSKTFGNSWSIVRFERESSCLSPRVHFQGESSYLSLFGVLF